MDNHIMIDQSMKACPHQHHQGQPALSCDLQIACVDLGESFTALLRRVATIRVLAYLHRTCLYREGKRHAGIRARIRGSQP